MRRGNVRKLLQCQGRARGAQRAARTSGKEKKKKRFLILAGSEQGSPGWDSRSFRDSCALQAAQNSQGTNPSAQAVPRASPLHGMQIQVNQSFGSSLCSFGIRRSFPEGILALECSGNSWDFFFFSAVLTRSRFSSLPPGFFAGSKSQFSPVLTQSPAGGTLLSTIPKKPPGETRKNQRKNQLQCSPCSGAKPSRKSRFPPGFSLF